MFSSLARPRLFLISFFSIFPALVLSREKALFASSVTYCQPPETLLIDRFDIAFFPSNHSVSFNISAASVQENVNVTANLLLNVYGMTPVNVTIDLCSILSGALCPLPTYNFTGADTITLPDSLEVSNKVPGIAFVIPDLEGFAQLTLKETGTGNIKACVQATLSNGWSTHQPAVEWVTSSFALAAFLSAIFHSVFPDSLAPLRFLDLFYLYQAIATSAFLDLNYASLYRSFTLNFAWAIGLVAPTSDSSLQASIDRMRHLTGGQLADSTSSSAVGFVNRRLSPYNSHLAKPVILVQRDVNPLGEILTALSNTNLRATPIEVPPSSNFLTHLAIQPAVQGQVQTVTDDSSNVLEAGIPIYSNSLHIGTANAFMTSFIVCLIVLAIGLALLACGYFILFTIRRARMRKGKMTSFDYRSFVQAWLLRLGLIFLLPLLIFAFYQWTLKDSWLTIILTVITFLFLLVLLFYPPYVITKFVRRSQDSHELYNHTPPTYLTSLGPLYAHLRPERYYFFLLYLAVPLLKAIFISFASASGFAQVILLVVTEFVVLVLQIVLKPHRTKGGNILNTYLGVTRLVCTGLLIAFVEHIAVKAIPRTVIGAVVAVVWSVAVIVLILDLVVFHMLVPIWQTINSQHTAHVRSFHVGKGGTKVG
ncbi:hypothetical protein AGABI2DRAFT_185054 [Agaricus bisporus var. bisporus H97]|uniref:hypothetical protein n=1 Tax=Agaricus bisporus var. bisporus (strain H97 / ATCC MYA-4626 / FGSC 10389) TaxID=936046 RepID=UPI00029F5847|nr:hypothetical protein AGABI2DRAFT_185054 [Agaricus bisporus var. bisporus H97]EKV47047.1 hypothetical protein AGABI2DRAFT_185054 [Agaricus bisporus var. bisporus H97]